MRVLKPIKLSNGFMFVPIHYSHDPEKQSFEWREKMRASFPKPSDFDKEMEIDFGMHVGAPAYPQFSEVRHLAEGLPYEDRRPLWLMMDFNTNPMSLVVCQKNANRLLFLREFVYGPTTIDAVVLDFRLSYPEHKSTVVVYGDSTTDTNAQTAKSNWDVVRLAFRGYHITPQFRVPLANPRVGNRLNAMNRLLSVDSPCPILIERDLCPELIRDFREVILTPDGKTIYKEKDPDDPYYFRTHPSDAVGYMAMVEFPVVKEVMGNLPEKRKPMEYGKLLGEVEWGTQKERAAQAAKRRPMDKGRAV